MAFELVIFDCDGVLVDSEPLSNRILAERLTAIGLPTTTEDSIRDFMGRSLASGLEKIVGKLGRPLPDGFVDDYHAEVFAAFERELRPVPGLPEALDEIELPWCVASSSGHPRIRKALGTTGLLHRFEGRIFSATDVEHGKPAPDLFLHAAATMGAPAGVQAGLAAGMTVLGYAGFTDPALLDGARVFSSMAELPGLISDCAPRSGAARSA
jgi:beta-phosphoglucomutase-like phosphatase (HAD superfamily)